jgi:glutamyl-tRNA synthetase
LVEVQKNLEPSSTNRSDSYNNLSNPTMKTEELTTLAGSLAGDFRTIEPHLQALNKHLTLRTYLSGHSLTPDEARIWQSLKSNRAAIGFIRKGSLSHLTRWFVFVEQTHPEIQAETKAAEAEARAKVAAASKAGGSYDLALENTDQGVVTRFLPEPSGYLHIGHAKASLLSDHFARKYKGKLLLRLDDTNPAKESEEFQDAIVEDLALMGITPDSLSYTSDYFQYLYDMCVRMITEGLAYADDTDADTMGDERKALQASKRRERTVEENLRVFKEMAAASDEGRKNCIRAKIKYDDPNGTMRDPVIYRVNAVDKHHRTGDRWNVYPTYDFACPTVDSLEGVTHALRSTEYTDRNVQYAWFQEVLGLRKVYMWDFSRMNFVKTLLSKRKLAKLVDAGKVWGWDDPRMPTIRGVRRRGMTIDALREFIIKQGPSRNVVNMDWTSFWATNKKVIDPVAPRHTAILTKDMVQLKLTGADAPAAAFTEDRPKHPKNKEVGYKKWAFSSTLVIDQTDAKSFKPDEEITLMTWGNAVVREIPTSLGDGNPITALSAELNLKGDVKKTEKKITWLSTEGQDLVPAELWDFDFLITKDKLGEEDNFEDFLNPTTSTMDDAVCDAGVGELKAGDIIQLERRGYYRVDKGLGDWKDGEEGEKGKRVVLFCIPTGKTG